VGICGAGFASTHAADGGLNDGFLVRVSADLTQFIETTYFGGSRDDLINAVAMNPVTGEIVVAGQSTSRSLNCPKGPCSFSFYGLGAIDVYYGFVARFTPDLWSLGRASILMAFADVTFSALAVNPVTGDVYVGGNTTSTSFPGTQPDMTVASAGAQPSHAADGGKPDAIIAWLSSDLLIIQQSTWFGGDNGDYIGGMAIDPRSGDVLVTGYTFSSYLPCVTPPGPCAIAPQATHASDGGDLDGFVARVSSDLRQFQQTTYLGGNGADGFYAVAVHPASGDVITAGFTRSTNLACTTAGNGCANAPQPSHAPDFGKYDGYVARITSDMASIDRTPVPFAFAPIGNAPLSTLTTSAPVQITGIVDAAPVRIEGALGTAYCVSSAPACTCDVNGGFTASPGTLLNGQYVCVRHVSSTAPDQISASLFHAGTGAATFRVRTASTFDGGCSLDVDGNGAIDALTDGVMLIRAMSGLTGTAVTANAIGAHSARTTWAQIQAYLNGSCGTAFQP
jgi:hypothetical protein